MNKRSMFFLVIAVIAALVTILVWTTGIPNFDGTAADGDPQGVDWTTIMVTMIGSATTITCAVLATRRPSAPN